MRRGKNPLTGDNRLGYSPPMRVFLRHHETGLFYAGPGKWTEDHSEAWDFQRTESAMDAAWEAHLPAIVLLRFDNPLLEIPLTIIGYGK